MTEEHPHDAAAPEEEPASELRTGHPAVDEVLRSIERLDERPVDEHVAVFEQAHETLRRTLDEPADQPAEHSAEQAAGPGDGSVDGPGGSPDPAGGIPGRE